jgi:hypothetical protein
VKYINENWGFVESINILDCLNERKLFQMECSMDLHDPVVRHLLN